MQRWNWVTGDKLGSPQGTYRRHNEKQLTSAKQHSASMQEANSPKASLRTEIPNQLYERKQAGGPAHSGLAGCIGTLPTNVKKVQKTTQRVVKLQSSNSDMMICWRCDE